MRKRAKIAVTLTLLAACGLGAAAIAAWQDLTSPLPLPEGGALFEVPTGTSLTRLAVQLGERGLLRHPEILAAYARLSGDATRVQAGEYRLAAGATPLDLLDMLVRGNVVLHQFTVVEGWRFADMLAAMRQHPAITPMQMSGAEIMEYFGKPGTHPEGQFLPDTYVFPKGTADLEVLRWAHDALVRALDAEWQARSADIVLEDAYEALILASIIEKESALDSERRLISGVFQRRLERGMRLQTDPTVIYGLGDSYDGDLRRRDLVRDTPYNTYTRPGLPPTPIALPGAASIRAAMNPLITDALYFVATGDPDGSHRFSATIEEHNEAVRLYLERLRSGSQ